MKAGSNILNGVTKNPLAYGLGILILIIIVYFFGSKIWLFLKPKTILDPNKTTGKKTLSEIKNLVSEMYESLEGIFDSKVTKETIAKKWNELNDRDLTLAFNMFNKEHEKETNILGQPKGNLIEWIESEWNRGGDYMTSTSYTATLVRRLQNLIKYSK